MGLKEDGMFLGGESASIFSPDLNLYLLIMLCPLVCLIFLPGTYHLTCYLCIWFLFTAIGSTPTKSSSR